MNPGGVSMQIWINLTDPAVDPLKKAFFGPSVTVLKETMIKKDRSKRSDNRRRRQNTKCGWKNQT